MTAVVVRTQEELCRLKSYCECNNLKSAFGGSSKWMVWNCVLNPHILLRVWFDDNRTYEGYSTCWSESTPDVTDITVDKFINNFNLNIIGEIK